MADRNVAPPMTRRDLLRLIGVTAGASLTSALASGYEPAMIAIGGMCFAGALISLVFVSDKPSTAPRIAAPDRGCALPIPGNTEVRT